MKRDGIIHAQLAGLIAGLRHTQTFVICDAGLPVPSSTPYVDLGYRYGLASFADVTSTVLPEVVVEASWVSQDMLGANPALHEHLTSLGLRPEPIEHEEFKVRCAASAFVLRTGEATLFANVLCRAGVGFPTS